VVVAPIASSAGTVHEETGVHEDTCATSLVVAVAVVVAVTVLLLLLLMLLLILLLTVGVVPARRDEP
jgi:hypothetical protein